MTSSASTTIKNDMYRFSIDRGGTFTDIYAEVPSGKGYVVEKLLSEDPSYPDAPTEGIRRIIEKFSGTKIDRGSKIPTDKIEWIRMGTTVATNALLERKGARTLLLITKGHQHALQIGNQSRPEIFNLTLAKKDMVYERVLEVEERVRRIIKHHDDGDDGDDVYMINKANKIVTLPTSEQFEILQTPNLAALKPQLQQALDDGITSVAVVFMHSYLYPEHEKLVGQLCKQMNFSHISLSSELPIRRIVPRGLTACVDAYLTPLITKYLNGFLSAFDKLDAQKVLFMKSDGGLCSMNDFRGSSSILSGPAGGVVGFGYTAFDTKEKIPVIGFDMGGTSTDVSRYDGSLDVVYESEVEGVLIQAPQLDIKTVAAGGGSVLKYHPGRFVVGPESVGAVPGPICYGREGATDLAVTDANLLLGRIIPKYFPKMGEKKDRLLDLEKTRAVFAERAKEINADLVKRGENEKSLDEIAHSFIVAANTTMCRPIRSITEGRGFSVASLSSVYSLEIVASDHILACFGGAGGQHACAIARELRMKKIKIHRFSGILSAVGLGLADVQVTTNTVATTFYLNEDSLQKVELIAKDKAEEARRKLKALKFTDDKIRISVALNLRYEGMDTNIMIEKPEDGDYQKEFERQYLQMFKFKVNKPIKIDNVRVLGIGKANTISQLSLQPSDKQPEPMDKASVYFKRVGRVETAVYNLQTLAAGATLPGPCMIIDATSTILIEPYCTAKITMHGDIEIDVLPKPVNIEEKTKVKSEATLLSVFNHRFMSIAEQMGEMLRRTSISTNIKERLDFSCALFGPDGGLVANAPHLPVHLGAMQEAVRWQIQYLTCPTEKQQMQFESSVFEKAHCSKPGEGWSEGEVIMTNHPSAGGSHLPDITVITPVFSDKSDVVDSKGNKKPVFYVASRGHHADIGGISPGSMPPFSKSLIDEGASFKSFKLRKGLFFDEDGIKAILEAKDVATKTNNYVGTRKISDNLSDLKAQIAANEKGIALVGELIAEYSLQTVQAYMQFVQQNAEEAVRAMLRQIAKAQNLGAKGTVTAVDYMDDGSPIALQLTIDAEKGSAHFDFTGTAPQSYGNCNAPAAVTYSAIIYSLRCMVQDDIPLNQGCLEPITIHIPEGTMLSPSDDAAVVGGNVLTSQRVTDVILQAFEACACSQGCMNNFTFGDSKIAYYETIAGGGGAGPCWHGEHGVHSHMTNTRITDGEIVEEKYPILLRQFTLRKGSGGKGQFNGGDGVIRDFEFLKDLTIGILSERRSMPPRGLKGGEDAQRGQNILLINKQNINDNSTSSNSTSSSTSNSKFFIESSEESKYYRFINIGAKNSVPVSRSDRFRILSPGGGAWGPPSS